MRLGAKSKRDAAKLINKWIRQGWIIEISLYIYFFYKKEDYFRSLLGCSGMLWDARRGIFDDSCAPASLDGTARAPDILE